MATRGRKKGTPKSGGRQPGTPNKVKPSEQKDKTVAAIDAMNSQFLTEVGADGKTEFQRLYEQLSPADQMNVRLRLLNKSVGDKKAVDANINATIANRTIEDRLHDLCIVDDS